MKKEEFVEILTKSTASFATKLKVIIDHVVEERVEARLAEIKKEAEADPEAAVLAAEEALEKAELEKIDKDLVDLGGVGSRMANYNNSLNNRK